MVILLADCLKIYIWNIRVSHDIIKIEKIRICKGGIIMGLFDKVKGKKEIVDWSNAYVATPKFYGKPDGTPFGAIALTEGTETVLPKLPQNEYRVGGKVVSEWKLVLVSTTKDAIIRDIDYFTALKSVEKYSLDAKEESILVRGLTLSELESLRG